MAMFFACTGGGCRAARLAFTTFSFQSVITSALAVLVSPTSKVPIKYMLVVSFILASISLKVTRLTSCNRSHHCKASFTSFAIGLNGAISIKLLQNMD